MFEAVYFYFQCQHMFRQWIECPRRMLNVISSSQCQFCFKCQIKRYLDCYHVLKFKMAGPSNFKCFIHLKNNTLKESFYYTLLYEMPSNSKGNKLRLKNPKKLASESEGILPAEGNTLKF